MGRTYSKMVDVLLKQEKTDWTWREFMREIVGWEDVPSRKKALAHIRYVNARRRIVRNMNNELSKRKDCRILHCVQSSCKIKGGVIWFDKEESTRRILSKRLEYFVRTEQGTIKACERIIASTNASIADKKLARREKALAEKRGFRKATKFVKHMNMKSLPPALMAPPEEE